MDENKSICIGIAIIAGAICIALASSLTYHGYKTKCFTENGYEQKIVVGSSQAVWQKK